MSNHALRCPAFCVGLAAVLVTLPVPVATAENFPGPVQARIVRVIDGDTFTAEAMLWPGHVLTVNVRIRGIDAPEMHARCERERVAAEKARAMLAGLVAGGPVSMRNIGSGKYYGRVTADVMTDNGLEVAQRLLDAAVVRRYAAGKRSGWC